MNPTTPASPCRLLSFRKPEGLTALDPDLNLPNVLDWSQYVPLVIVYAVLLYGISVVLIRRIAVAKGYDGRNWLFLALVFAPIAAVAVSALPNRVLYQRICEIRDAAHFMAKGTDQPTS